MALVMAVVGWLFAFVSFVLFLIEKGDREYNEENWKRCCNHVDEERKMRIEWHGRAQSAEHDLEKIAAAVRLYDKKREDRKCR